MCAHTHSVSPSTVVAAYDLLQAQGLVEARRQRGFFVRDRAALPTGHGRTGRRAGAAAGAGGRHGADPQHVPARQGGQGGPGMGTLPEPGWMPALLQRALRRVCGRPNRRRRAWLRYGDPAGDAGLRARAGAPPGRPGHRRHAGQIVTTIGATHALDLVARTLLQPRATRCWWTSPAGRWSSPASRAVGMRLLPVPRGPDGAGPGRDGRTAAGPPAAPVRHGVGAAQPDRQSLTLAARTRCCAGRAHDLTIVEDDTYSLAGAAARHHGWRSWTACSARSTCRASRRSWRRNWRVGYLAAAPALAERLIDTKLLGTLTTPGAAGARRGLVPGPGHCCAAMPSAWPTRLDAARPRTVRLAARQRLPASCRRRRQGLFGWVDVGVDTEPLAQRLLDEGWLLAPGTLFHATPRPSTLMRINFATAQDARFWQQFAAPRGVNSWRRARLIPRIRGAKIRKVTTCVDAQAYDIRSRFGLSCFAPRCPKGPPI
jgi:DNA-binding transcriptional MocR family regulator